MVCCVHVWHDGGIFTVDILARRRRQESQNKVSVRVFESPVLAGASSWQGELRVEQRHETVRETVYVRWVRRNVLEF